MAAKMQQFNKSFLTFLKQRSSDYQQYGRYLVKDCGLEDLGIRFISFVGDLSASVIPILIWLYIFLLVCMGVLPYTVFSLVTPIMEVILMISVLFVNTYTSILFKGQTFGKIAMNFKVVSERENKECDNKTLVLRQLLGFGIPIVLFTFFLNIVGFMAVIAVNAIFVIVDKKHRSIIDVILKTKVVKLDNKGKKHTFEVQKEEKIERVEPAENVYDLHVYSVFSHDGESEVEDLFKKAQAKGIKALSICDHNSVKANAIAQKIAPLYGIQYIPGINIDCEFEGNQIRLLGYYVNSNDDRFIQIEHENLAKEKVVSSRRIELFEEFTGFKVNTEKLLARNRFQVVTKEMLARHILSTMQYRETKLLQPYLTGSKKDRPITNFIKDFFAPGAPAYVPTVHPKAKDMIDFIHANGGVVVVAHPMHSLRNKEDVLERLLALHVEGIELFTPYHTKADMKYLISLAKNLHLDITAGSEYHGVNKPSFILGKTYCPKDVEEVVLKFIQKYKRM